MKWYKRYTWYTVSTTFRILVEVFKELIPSLVFDLS